MDNALGVPRRARRVKPETIIHVGGWCSFENIGGRFNLSNQVFGNENISLVYGLPPQELVQVSPRIARYRQNTHIQNR